jgi:hypothetical protein
MAVLGTKIPCKDAKFTFDGVEVGLENATLRAMRDLVDVSDNASGGSDELVPCFRRFSLDCDAAWRTEGWGVSDGDEVLFTATIVPTAVIISNIVLIESIELAHKAKDVWRVKISAKSSGPIAFSLPPP